MFINLPDNVHSHASTEFLGDFKAFTNIMRIRQWEEVQMYPQHVQVYQFLCSKQYFTPFFIKQCSPFHKMFTLLCLSL